MRPGNGDGSFGSSTTYAVGLDPWWVSTARLGDGDVADIVVANGLSGTISVLVGNGDGTFRPSVSY